MGKQTKRARKFIAKGHLSDKIKRNNKRKKFNNSKLNKNGKDVKPLADEDVPVKEKKQKKVEELNIDEFLDASFLDADSSLDEEEASAFINNNKKKKKKNSLECDETDSDDDDILTSQDDQDDDDDEEEESVLDKKNNSLQNEVDEHVQVLKDLEKSDPSFYHFLQQNDKNLLDFQDNDPDDDDDEDDEDDAANQEDKADTDPTVDEKEKKVLTLEVLKSLEKKAFQQKSLKFLQRLFRVFISACHIHEQDVNDEKSSSSKRKALSPQYEIRSSAVYNRLMITVLCHTHKVVAHHLDLEEIIFSEKEDKKQETITIPEKEKEKEKGFDIHKKDKILKKITTHSKWPQLHLSLRAFFNSILHLISDVQDVTIQSYVLKQLEHYLIYGIPIRKMSMKLLKVLLNLWSSSPDQHIRILAFLRLRQLALNTPFPFIEDSLKGIYLSYVKNAKFTNETSWPMITLMGNCVVELYGLDLTSSYQHAFVYIRQLSIQLRNALLSKTKETFAKVYNWQFLNSLKVWTAVLSAYPKEDQLKALIYPLCQILFGTAKLLPSAKYIPLRLHCIQLLQQLAVSSDQFIPTAPLLLDILNTSELSKRSVNSMISSLELQFYFKLSTKELETQVVKDAIVSKTFSLLTREYDIYKFNIGYPEMIVPSTLSLRKFAGNTKVPRWSTMAKGLVLSMEKRSAFIVSQRSSVEYSPKDVEKMETFLAQEAASAKARMAQSDLDREKHLLAEVQKKRNDKNKKISTSSNSTQKNNNTNTTSNTLQNVNPEQFSALVQEMDQDEDDVVEEFNWSSGSEE